MIDLLSDRQDFVIRVYPKTDFSVSQEVRVEVTLNFVRQSLEGAALGIFKWEEVYRAFAERLDVNEHQLSAMANGLGPRAYAEVLWKLPAYRSIASGLLKRSEG